MEAEDLERKVRVFVIGGKGSGKTTFINMLLDQTNSHSENDEIHVYRSVLSHQHNAVESLSDDIVLDVWEVPGSKVWYGLYHVIFTEPAVYVVLVEAGASNPEQEAVELCRNIQLKMKTPQILVLLTKQHDKSEGKTKSANFCQNITDRLNEHNTNSSNNGFSNGPSCNSHETFSTRTDPVIHETTSAFLVQPFNSNDPKNIQQLKQIVLRFAAGIYFDRSFNVSSNSCLQKALEFVQKKAKERLLFLNKNQLKEFSDSIEDNDASSHYLEKKGVIKEFKISTEEGHTDTVVCVNLLEFANILIKSHLEPGKHVFKLEASKFWPVENNRPAPNPDVLAGILDDFKTKGIVAESFLPILWNTPFIRKDQIAMVLKVTESLGLTCSATSYGQALPHVPSLELPYFSYLSNDSRHRFVLMNKLPEVRPVLHWTENPNKDDFQITIHFTFPSRMPIGLQQRAIAICLNVNKSYTQYHHIWQEGVFIQLGYEVKINLQTYTNEIDFIARVVTEAYQDLKTATQVLWMTICPSLVEIYGLCVSFPGLQTEIFLSVRGGHCFDEIFFRSSIDKRFTLGQLVAAQLQNTESTISKWLIPFRIDSTVTCFKTWLQFLMLNRKDVLQILAPDFLLCNNNNNNNLEETRKTEVVRKKSSRKKLKVSWDIGTKQEGDIPSKTDNEYGSKNNKKERKRRSVDVRTREDSKSEEYTNSVYSPSKDLAESKQLSVCEKTSNVFDEVLAYKLASSFSTSVLTSSIARFMEEDNEINNNWSERQVFAVRNMSRLSASVWSGNMSEVSSTISHTVKSNQHQEVISTSRHMTSTLGQSRFCVVL